MIGATAVSRDSAAPYWGTIVLRAKGRLRVPWYLLELAAQRLPAPGHIGMRLAGGQTYWLTMQNGATAPPARKSISAPSGWRRASVVNYRRRWSWQRNFSRGISSS